MTNRPKLEPWQERFLSLFDKASTDGFLKLKLVHGRFRSYLIAIRPKKGGPK